jgi:hypothetical protein
MLLWIADFDAFGTTDFAAIPGDSVMRRRMERRSAI